MRIHVVYLLFLAILMLVAPAFSEPDPALDVHGEPKVKTITGDLVWDDSREGNGRVSITINENQEFTEALCPKEIEFELFGSAWDHKLIRASLASQTTEGLLSEQNTVCYFPFTLYGRTVRGKDQFGWERRNGTITIRNPWVHLGELALDRL